MQVEIASRKLLAMRKLTDEPAPAGLTVHYKGAIESRGADIPAVHQFLVDIAANAAGGVVSGVVVAWLLRFRGPAEKVTINRREVDLDDEGRVRGIVEEEVVKERG